MGGGWYKAASERAFKREGNPPYLAPNDPCVMLITLSHRGYVGKRSFVKSSSRFWHLLAPVNFLGRLGHQFP